MSIVETVLVFVGIPAAIYAVVGVLVMAPGAGRSARYRPGRAWAHEPVWYVPRPVPTRSGHLPGHPPQGELTAAGPAAHGSRTAKGGASGTW